MKGSLGYWGTPGGTEVDFIWWRGDRVVAVECKAARQYRREFRKGIAALATGTKPRGYIVYLGERELLDEGTAVLPVATFLQRLHAGDIIG